MIICIPVHQNALVIQAQPSTNMSPRDYIYFSLLTCASLLSLSQWRRLQSSAKYLAVLMILTFVAEAIALYISRNSGNNLFIYHISSPIEFLLISLYFNESVTIIAKRRIGLFIGILGIVLSVMNSLFFQKPTSINTYFLLFEGTAIIIYCLLSFHQILLDEEYLPYRNVHFWISICFILFWSTTFTGWGIYAVRDSRDVTLVRAFSTLLTIVNFLFYFGIAAIFLNYKKLTPSGA